MLPRGVAQAYYSKRGSRREARAASLSIIISHLQPGAGTTVEKQVEGEFGDRSPVCT